MHPFIICRNHKITSGKPVKGREDYKHTAAKPVIHVGVCEVTT